MNNFALYVRAKNILRFVQLYWPQIGNGLVCMSSFIWYLKERTPASLTLIFLSILILMPSVGYVTAVRLRADPAAIICNWIGSLGGALAFGIASPQLFPISILCIIDGALTTLTIEHDNKLQMRTYGVVAVITLVFLNIFTEAARNGYRLFDLHFTPAQVAACLTIYAIGYSMTIGRHIQHFFDALRSTIYRLSHSNKKLVVTKHELQQRLIEHTQLLAISHAIGSTQDLDSLLTNTLMQLKTVVLFDRASVLLLRDYKLHILASHGAIPENQQLPLHLIQNPSYADQLITNKQSILVADLRVVNHIYDGTLLAVPLTVRGNVIGVLTIRSLQKNFYDQHHADLCLAFANQVAGMIDAAQLQEAAASAMVVAERHRLARELHDSVSQSLFGIVLGTRTAFEQVERAPLAAQDAINYSIRLADDALSEMRALVFTLRPEILEQKGLVAALQSQVNLSLPAHDVRITLTAPNGEPQISPQVKEALYRITSEALRNAIHHSACRTVDIRITTQPALRIDIIDDGHGFDPTAEYENHLGLKSMRERADACNGHFEIISSPDHGTHVFIEIAI